MLKTILTWTFIISISSCSSVVAKELADISLVLRRLENLEQKVEILESENDLLKAENRKVVSKMKSIHEELETIKSSKIYQTKGGNTDIVPKPALKENETSYMDNKVNSRNRVSVQRDRGIITPAVNQKQKRLLTGASSSTTSQLTVAFRASLAKTIPSLGSHQVVEYDEVPLNIGNAYDARHGHFTAPVKGLYLLSFNLFAQVGKYTVLDVVKNGNRIADLSADGRPSAYGSQSKVFPIILEKGDMIWIRTYPGFEGESLGGYQQLQHNMFAAVLLQEL